MKTWPSAKATTEIKEPESPSRSPKSSAGTRLHEDPWYPFQPQSDSQPDAIDPTGPPRFPAALRRVGGRMALGLDSSAGDAREMGVRFPNLSAPDATAERSDAELRALPVLRFSAVDAVSRNGHAIGHVAARQCQSDHQDGFSF